VALVVALLGSFEASAQRGRGLIPAGIFGLTPSMAVTSAGAGRAARREGWSFSLGPEPLGSESPEPVEPSPSSESLDGRPEDIAAESELGSTELSMELEDEALLESTRRSAAAQERCDAGDFDGAIALWSELLAEVSPTPEQAPRRASILLAIVDAHERAYVAERDPRRLRVAIELLDHYLGELAPTDDENRVAVEARRSALVQRLEAAATGSVNGGGDDAGPVPRGPDPQVQVRAARRWTVVGGALVGVGAGGVVLMGAGMGLGRRADEALTAAVNRSPTDPQRSGAIADAYADGLLANRLAYAGGIAGGLLLVGGSVALLRGRRLRLAPGPVALGLTLGGRF